MTDTNARATTVRRDKIQEIRPSATSIMPPGLAAALGDSAVRDLIAYLTSPAPRSHQRAGHRPGEVEATKRPSPCLPPIV